MSDIQGAANAAAGTSGLALQGALQRIADQSGTSVAVPSPTLVIFGDSMTDNSGRWPARLSANNNAAQTILFNDQRGPINWALTRLGQRLKMIGERGTPGDTTAQMLARVSEVVALAPGYCLVFGGANDLTAETPSATVIANLKGIVDTLTAAGIKVLLGEVIPWQQAPSTAMNATKKQIVADVNAWIRSYGKATPVPWNDIVSDPTTGLPLASAFATSGTDIHPANEGGARQGLVLTEVLDALVPPLNPFRMASDPAQLLVNPNQVGGGSGTPPSSWSVSNAAAATFTQTKVARTDSRPGEWTQFAVTAVGTNEFYYQQIVTGFSSKVTTGDYVRALLEFEASGIGSPYNFLLLQVEFRQGGTTLLTSKDLFGLVPPNAPGTFLPASGVFRTPEVPVPANCDTIIFRATMYGVGTYRFGRADLRKVALSEV